MVVKMMKWRGLASKKYEAKITVHHLTTLLSPVSREHDNWENCRSRMFSVEIKWGGSKKGIGLRSFRRNFTREERLLSTGEDGGGGLVRWDEDFQCLCTFLANNNNSKSKDKDLSSFHPWEISFTLLNGMKQVVGTATLNLADFAAKRDAQIDIPLSIGAGCGIDTDISPSLYLSIILQELRNAAEGPLLSFPRSPCYGELFLSSSKQETSTCKPSPTGTNTLNGLSAPKANTMSLDEGEGSDGRSSDTSDDIGLIYPLDTDSVDSSDKGNDSEGPNVGKSLGYETLAKANHAGDVLKSSTSEDEDRIYYSHCRPLEEDGEMCLRDKRVPKRRILPWRKRKLSFRSSFKVKGEPLLKKCYGEEGGDDIDFDRRQLSSSDESILTRSRVSSIEQTSAFGDDTFAVGVWEHKEILSRDAHLKLKAQVFFATIDQRNERAAGESACTALVAVIADWFQSNRDEMPIRSQLDNLIREGSLEWRNLCENETYRKRFPDKHFDLDTVLEAKIRPLSVIPQKSFVGFFRLEEPIQEDGFDFLQGAMSFDNIWDEICQCAFDMPMDSSEPVVYIISWNDHFFVLKVEHDSYYIIDTLGERLHEGCNQAFILKFDRDTTIYQASNEAEKKDGEPNASGGKTEKNANDNEPIEVCKGKESCKEYIKSFLAAIPIRELQVDQKKGQMTSMPLHHRLQIEFHYTIPARIHDRSQKMIQRM